ncbi:putative glycoside hydrolase [Heterostelium album PN500]|uniref:Endoglucanase n=1 Tax=Heterostelium pallidum (strain ATCC 26659 / Pp 5 / PN500) TaxID=670386 RepID=D3BD23_HETP5|nr:putative glycoside hydrolase [Heterostelium album PN500]EFA80815.1 putative glycoside hydrolase [Heterostelium album PN500]|eukprot:XP_020432934.1 putative glycoside hydrolase [Heterostelium album PN500]
MKYIILSIVLLSVFVSLNLAQNGIDYCVPLYASLMFYKAQRAGKLPDNDVPWRADSVLNDGQDLGIDLSGGYFDAGDYIKFTFPLAYVMTTLGWSYVQFQDNIVNKCHLQDEYLSVLKYGTDWIMNAHYDANHLVTQVDVMNSHSAWNKPSDIDYKRTLFTVDNTQKCTDVAMQSASALAMASLAFASTNPTYSTQLLTKAKSLYTLGKNCPAGTMVVPDTSQGYSSSGYQDEQIWASICMYLATGRSTSTTYYSDLTGSLQALQGRAFNDIWSVVISWDSKYSAAAMMAFKSLSSDPNLSQFSSSLQSLANAIVTTWSNQDKFTNGIVSSKDGWQWGNNRYSMGGAFLAAVMNSTDSNNWAKQQVNCVLGQCPSNSKSYVIGYGNNYALFPHHRAAHNPVPQTSGGQLTINYPVATTYTLLGALIGGPSIQNPSYTDTRDNYIQNEPAIDYNAGFTGALAGLVNFEHTGGYNGNPTSTTSSQSTTSTTSSQSTTTTTTSKPTTTSSTTSSQSTSSTTTTAHQSTSSTTSHLTTNGEEPTEDPTISSGYLLKSSFIFVLLTFVFIKTKISKIVLGVN